MTSSSWLKLGRSISRRRSVILCYHGIARATAEDDPEFLRVDPDRFRGQVEFLAGSGFDFVTVADLASRLDGGPPPAGLAALSFDDGLQDNHEVLLPILRGYGIPASVYVMTGHIGRRYPWMPERAGARLMTESELRELASAGIELGAHTVTHPDLSTLGQEECLREIVESRRTLERLTGAEVRTFAYPFCKYGEAAVAAVREAGFAAAVTCQGRGDWSRFTLKRALITGKDGPVSFVLKLVDAYQPLFDSVPGRLVRSTTRGLRRRVRTRLGRRD
jgi:peptidoglycan/xylan/chitin deacetylase (PgdA/CDA1 family)